MDATHTAEPLAAGTRAAGSAASTRTAVYAALIGDVLIAGTKTAAAVFTGSAAMASEAIHSAVDTVNEILLLYGMHRSGKRPDEDHPFGFGRELYFWSFVVAVLIFAFGAGVSIYEGVGQIRHPHPIADPGVNYVILALSFLFDGVSWLFSLRQFRAAKGHHGFIEALKLSKDPPSFMVMFQGVASMLGIVIAGAGIFASVTLGRPEFDGMASVAIGLVLAATSAFLAQESKSLLIGEQTYPGVRKSILEIANSAPHILKANGVVTAQLAPDQVVAMLSVEFDDAMRAPEIEEAVVDLEHKVRTAHPQIVALFIKPQTEKRFRESQAERLGGDPIA
jgi:cation diffusion facilitator family transporter